MPAASLKRAVAEAVVLVLVNVRYQIDGTNASVSRT